jgi:hypothetical protein
LFIEKKLTGESEPTLQDEGAPMFQDYANKEYISNSDPIDVYVWCSGGDGVLRVDL